MARHPRAQARRGGRPTRRQLLVTVDGARVHAPCRGRGAGPGADPRRVRQHPRLHRSRLVRRWRTRYRVTPFDRPGLGWSDAYLGEAGGTGLLVQAARLLRGGGERSGSTQPDRARPQLRRRGGAGLGLRRSGDTARAVDRLGAVDALAGRPRPWYRVHDHAPPGARSRCRSSPPGRRNASCTQRDRRRSSRRTRAPGATPTAIGAALSPCARSVLGANAAAGERAAPRDRERWRRVYPQLTDAGRDRPRRRRHHRAAADPSRPLSRLIPGARLTRAARRRPHAAPRRRPAAVHRAIDRAAARAGLR